jgi:heme iron utilization protein
MSDPRRPAVPGDHQYPGDAARLAHAVGRELPRATAADAARTLVDGATTGLLSTLAVEPAGYPFGSVVSFGLEPTGSPLFVISRLAEHTRNVSVDGRASVLVTEAHEPGRDPLGAGRVTLIGDVAIVPEAGQAAAVAMVVDRVPAVGRYAGYGDFACYRLEIRAVRWVGGFGAMDWVEADAYRTATVDPVLPRRHGIIAHMNADHADAQVLYCRNLLGLDDTTAATMSSVDRYGFDMVAEGPTGRVVVRLGFPQPCDDGLAVRQAMVALVAEARAAG